MFFGEKYLLYRPKPLKFQHKGIKNQYVHFLDFSAMMEAQNT